jgi:ABC-2 type transport system permease protein
MFLNGSILPVENLPGWLEPVARVMPGTQGIIVLRCVTLEGLSLADTWTDGSLRWLVLHSVLFFAAGWAVYWVGERYARRRGTLGQY